DTVIEMLDSGIDTIQASISYIIPDNVENLILTGSDNIDGTGNDLDNVLVGNTGNNVLTGGAGNDHIDGGLGVDTLIGGTGNEIYIVDNTGDTVMELVDEGNDFVYSSVTYTLPDNVENLTLTGNDNINGTGNELDNVLTGNSGDNILDGDLGADTMSGGLGNDTYFVDNTGDVVTENTGEGIDTVQSSISYTLGTNVENLNLTGSENINGAGNEMDNVISGNSGNNIIDGGAGNDILAADAGNDILRGGTGDDIYIYGLGSGNDTIENYVDNTGGIDIVQFGAGLTIDSFDYLQTGDDLVLRIKETGETLVLRNWFEGGASQVSKFVFADGSALTAAEATGRIGIIGTTGSDVLVGDDRDNRISGLGGDDTLYGQGGNDQLFSGDGNDLLDGGIGADNMAGGTGDDTYVVDNEQDIVTELAGEGIDTVQTSFSYQLGANVENLILTGSNNLTGTGNALDNVIAGSGGRDILYGNEGNDTLNGGANADKMYGGAGDDTYFIDNKGDAVYEQENAGIDTVQSLLTYSLGSFVENLTLLGNANIAGYGNGLDNVLTGNSGNNLLYGGNGNDFIDGGAGADVMVGGQGNDTYVVNDGGDLVSELFTGGNDTVHSSISYSLGIGLENLELLGTANINGTGNLLDNDITGNSGNNILEGDFGNDVLSGEAGNDSLYGGLGEDILKGGTGNDFLEGGYGRDVYMYTVGDGNDVINNYEAGWLNSTDTLQFQNLVLAGIEFTRDKNDLVCTITSTGETVRVTNWMVSSNYQVENFVFSDTTLSARDVSAKISA
ncbi:MAG TPA: hypothetical protein DEA44_06620, partial [Firmicutes bacterium]|nr:hypothetical protein [Bacillota bacterium]